MYRHILIPTDGSELAERGVAHGLALAKSLGARVSIIYVVEPLLAVTGDFASVLDRAENAAKEAGVSCETIQVENVQPHQASSSQVLVRHAERSTAASPPPLDQRRRYANSPLKEWFDSCLVTSSSASRLR
jgi:nucleotide-binding universal stress UspA family protein